MTFEDYRRGQHGAAIALPSVAPYGHRPEDEDEDSSSDEEETGTFRSLQKRLQTYTSGAPAAVSASPRRPRMWSGGSCYSAPAPPSAGTKRPLQDDDDSDDEDDEILPLALPPPSNRRSKKRRTHRLVGRFVSPCSSPSFPAYSSYSYDEPLFRRRTVRFASPLVTDVRTRPRTPKEDVPGLFYRKADERRFREELRRERRLRRLGLRALDDEGKDGAADDAAAGASTADVET